MNSARYWLIVVWLCGTTQAARAQTPAERLRLRRTPVVEVFEKCKDAVVNISTTQIVEVRTPFDDFDRFFNDLFELPTMPRRPQRFRTSAVGSGFVLHRNGYIVTNAHVVIRTAERKAGFADQRQFDADIVGVDLEHDLAIIKVQPDKPLPVLDFAPDDDLMVGETVIAIGNPLGLQNTVTAGVISALDRSLEVGPRTVYRGLIQTDAPINPGNSGGPLLNVLGELIGVNTAIRGDAQNIGFAIPAAQLRAALPVMLDVERRYRIAAGLRIEGVPPTVVEVAPGSPAGRAGVRQGDLLRSIDNEPVRKAVDYYIALIGRMPGQSVALVLDRSGQGYRATFVLAERPAPDGFALARKRLGIDVESITPQWTRRLGLENLDGLLVTRVEAGSPAGQLGLEPADILVAVHDRRVKTPDDLGMVLERIDSGQRVRLTILRSAGNRLHQFTADLVVR